MKNKQLENNVAPLHGTSPRCVFHQRSVFRANYGRFDIKRNEDNSIDLSSYSCNYDIYCVVKIQILPQSAFTKSGSTSDMK